MVFGALARIPKIAKGIASLSKTSRLLNFDELTSKMNLIKKASADKNVDALANQINNYNSISKGPGHKISKPALDVAKNFSNLIKEGNPAKLNQLHKKADRGLYTNVARDRKSVV